MSGFMDEEDDSTIALVVTQLGGPFEVRRVSLKDMRADEIIVRMVATGVCHTDFASINGTIPVPLPVVVGHEGAGVVEKVGSEVKSLAEGDHVLLTYNSCMECVPCRRGNPAYCRKSFHLRLGGSRLDLSKTLSMDGQDIYSAFFGQSSFAYRSIVHSVCAVKIEKGLPLDVLAPLGCGIQTGAGTILNILKPTVGSSLVIFGAGAVGLAGVMAAARFTPASVIIAVDIVDAKLELAKELGATHAINSKGVNVVDEIKSLTNGDGADFAYDATGNIQAIQNMIEAAASNAVIATVGSPSRGQKVFIEPATWLQRGISYVGSCQGSAVPQQFIPAMVELWKQGRFPVDRLVKRYHYTELDKVKQDLESGDCIKPVLLWE